MTSLAYLDTEFDRPARRDCAPDGWTGLLDSLRHTALSCRAAQRSDLFQACALLSFDKNVAQAAYAAALVKGLHSATTKESVFFRPGVSDRSFDETWIIAALSAIETQDHDSLMFLLNSRICAIHRRSIAFLLHGILGKIRQT